MTLKASTPKLSVASEPACHAMPASTDSGDRPTPITPAWLGRPAAEVAPDLLGCLLVRRVHGIDYRGLIVETEAYDASDPACHGYRRQTPRNAAIFGAPGTVYVYRIYGVYHCLNVVTAAAGECSAVLLRAVALDRVPPWVERPVPPARVAAGPGKLCRALQIDLRLNGAALIPGTDLWLEARSPAWSAEIVQTTRIGITQGADIPWRWYVRHHAAVSKK